MKPSSASKKLAEYNTSSSSSPSHSNPFSISPSLDPISTLTHSAIINKHTHTL
ncbi:hypothetical protein Hanom_Chr03g00178781 [Helianthus anomalus]